MSLAYEVGLPLVAEADVHAPWNGHDTRVLIMAVLGIAIIVVLIVALKVHAFLSLTIGALFVGVASGIGAGDVTKSYENGVGSVLGYVGVLIALGAMVGKLLADSGGADQVVDTLLRGKPGGLPWKMALIAFIIGIPMFFEIGLVLLIPVVVLAVRRTGARAMLLGIPALAGLSVLHGFVPPHPGPLAAIGVLKGNVGITLALGLLVAIPTVIVAGPLFGRLAAKWVPIGAAGAALEVGSGHHDSEPAPHTAPQGGTQVAAHAAPQTATPQDVAEVAPHDAQHASPQPADGTTRTRTPSFAATLSTVLLPVALMLIKAASDIWMSKNNAIYPVLQFIGDPVVALLIAVLLAMYTFGTAVGFGIPALSKKIGESLLPISAVMLIVGAGGGFKQVLVDGGTGTAIAKIAIAANLSALLLGWIVAVLIRLATGSATVATVTAAGIVAPLAGGLSTTHIALVVLAIGAGSLFFSHVNDAGFWLVKEYFGMTVGETIKTWSVMETVISVMGLGMTLLLSTFL
ncbi:GntP family gluconate:H+ symporter [Kribbella aluminosa]|uniref:GntP family gluconate:H+ symporter n=1 Tax=Kribbella aluminosa TaxID=416017 RepID=A0ABS4UNI1_9ACTN|nr:SLC13 family permease [Kribbella aluminosa]MBP2353141.1 GntP family gluconate:H+ symporter [Kribbella aluminosa]